MTWGRTANESAHVHASDLWSWRIGLLLIGYHPPSGRWAVVMASGKGRVPKVV